GGQPLVLIGIGQGGGIQLTHLVPQEVHLTGPGPGVAAQGSQLLLDLPHLGPGRGQWFKVDPGEGVEGGPLHRGPEQRLMGLPAPVSPVSAVIPGPNTNVRSAITPRSRTRSSASIIGRAVRTWP